MTTNTHTSAKLPEKDRIVLRRLAGRCREIVESDRNQSLLARWANLNDLKHEGPPLLLVSPEGAWREIIPRFPVECESDQGRAWEQQLRQLLYRHDVIEDDSAFDGVFNVVADVTTSDLGVPFQQTRSGDATGACHIDAVLDNLESDLERLTFRRITFDRKATEMRVALAVDTFGDLLSVTTQTDYWWTCGLTLTAIHLIGLETLMLAMYDNPRGLHRLMRLLSDEMLNFITCFEREGLLALNAGANYIGSGNLGFTSALPAAGSESADPVRLNQCWGFAESQETVGVSPEMFGEFVYPYQRPLLETFGLTYYGCCEACESRWLYIKKTPNLRCVSVAPWSNQQVSADQLGRDYVYCRKPNPSAVSVGFNEAEIRREFAETLTYAGTLNTVVVLKDTHTVEHQPERFANWVTIGRETFGGDRSGGYEQ